MSRSAAYMLAVALLTAAGCEQATKALPPDQITVTTNKSHYAPREPILVTVSNTGESPVWLWLYDCLPSQEKQSIGGWEPEVIQVCPAGWSYYRLDPGQSREATWETLSSGRYRVLVYSYGAPGCTPEDLCQMRPADVHRSLPLDVD